VFAVVHCAFLISMLCMKRRKERLIMIIKVLFIAPYTAMARLIDECKTAAEDLAESR
jgi:hypothetical protein